MFELAAHRLGERRTPVVAQNWPVTAVRVEPTGSIDPTTLYRILRLRVDVFVVEQACAYPELDGRDLEPGARQVWIEADGEVLATLRMLRDDDDRTVRIGRVATAAVARSRGLARQLMDEALRRAAGLTVVLDAQSQLQDWYARFGFVPSGPEFIEDDIPHVPMVLRPGGVS